MGTCWHFSVQFKQGFTYLNWTEIELYKNTLLCPYDLQLLSFGHLPIYFDRVLVLFILDKCPKAPRIWRPSEGTCFNVSNRYHFLPVMNWYSEIWLNIPVVVTLWHSDHLVTNRTLHWSKPVHDCAMTLQVEMRCPAVDWRLRYCASGHGPTWEIPNLGWFWNN